MNPLQIFKSENYWYYSDKTLEALKADMQKAFDKSNRFLDFSFDFYGEFKSDNTFIVTAKGGFTAYSNGGKTTIQGTLTQDVNNKACVNIKVKPALIYIIPMILFPLTSICALLSQPIDEFNKDGKIVLAVFLFIAPMMFYYMLYTGKANLRENFVNAFKLKEASI